MLQRMEKEVWGSPMPWRTAWASVVLPEGDEAREGQEAGDGAAKRPSLTCGWRNAQRNRKPRK